MKSARDMQRITPKKHDSSAYTLRNALHVVLHFMQCAEKLTDFPPIFAMWADKKAGENLDARHFLTTFASTKIK